MANTRILVVYYSRSGTTREVARALSAALQCDTEEIVETRDRGGAFGYLRSLIEARRRRAAATVQPTKQDPSVYHLVVIGSPVWVWSVSSPVRAYMETNRTRFPAVAFFCTCGGAGAESAFAQMRELAGKAPRARAFFTARQVASRRLEPRLSEFVAALAGPNDRTADTAGADHANAAKISSTAFS